MKLSTREPRVWSQSAERILSVQRNNYRFNISVRLFRDLKLSGDERIAIAKDEDSQNDWYMAVTRERGSKITISRRNSKGEAIAISFSNKSAANEILNAVKATSFASFIVATKATLTPDGNEWFRIITSIPKKIR